MRIAIFIDGKNFYSPWRGVSAGRRIDFQRLARWIVQQSGGSILTGAHYYTGVEPDSLNDEGTRKLHRFLDQLEAERGYFTYRFIRRTEQFHCDSCGAANSFSREKEVDTTMTADMLRLAAVNAFDAMVLVSGDSDLAPALEGVRAIGKIASVASWGGSGMSARLRRVAYDHIDLMSGLSDFAVSTSTEAEPPLPPTQLLSLREIESLEDRFVRELERAIESFAPGYVGVNYFVTRWRGDNFDLSPPERRRVLDILVASGRVEIYEVNGNKALRVA